MQRSSPTDSNTPQLSPIWGLGFRVWGLGFRVLGLGFRVWGLGFRVWGFTIVGVSMGSCFTRESYGLGVYIRCPLYS